MSYLNQVTLIGNLGKDPEVLNDSGNFVRLQLATTEKYTNAKGESVTDTQWHTVYLNNGVGKYASTYLKKGAKVLVVGKLRNNKWTDKTGEVRHSTDVYGSACKLITQKPDPKEETNEPV